MNKSWFRPMKGVPAPADLTQLRYPLIASEKLDGWRAVIVDAGWARTHIPCEPKHREYFDAARHTIVLSASNKPISNWSVQRRLDRPELMDCDGELICADRFNETSSALASQAGEPAFAFHIFDVLGKPNDPFAYRLAQLGIRHLPPTDDNTELHKHPQLELLSSCHLEHFLEELPPTAEGAITRDPKGLYKFGRATEKQQWLLKIKPFVDAEAVVIGAEELMHNENDPEVNQLGLQRRPSHKAGQVPSNKLGALVCKALRPGGGQPDIEDQTFRIGTGFTDSDRYMLWSLRDTLPGRIVKFKSMKHGALDAPRHPVWLGFRAEDYESSVSDCI